MREFVVSNALKKDIKLSKKRGKDLTKFKEVVRLLMDGDPIPETFKDHPLVGNWNGYRELHLETDFLFIYRLTETELFGQRLGTHSDLF